MLALQAPYTQTLNMVTDRKKSSHIVICFDLKKIIIANWICEKRKGSEAVFHATPVLVEKKK